MYWMRIKCYTYLKSKRISVVYQLSLLMRKLFIVLGLLSACLCCVNTGKACTGKAAKA